MSENVKEDLEKEEKINGGKKRRFMMIEEARETLQDPRKSKVTLTRSNLVAIKYRISMKLASIPMVSGAGLYALINGAISI